MLLVRERETRILEPIHGEAGTFNISDGNKIYLKRFFPKSEINKKHPCKQHQRDDYNCGPFFVMYAELFRYVKK